MSLLRPDPPIGRPAFALSEDEIATVVALICDGTKGARVSITPGMLEVPITRIVRKAMRRSKRALGLTNVEIHGEEEIDNMSTLDPAVLGRIDITLKFLHQFGDEDAYVAVECKRVGAGLHALNAAYVAKGVSRFAAGQYGRGHEWGFMLGYVLALPVGRPIKSIERRIVRAYGTTAKLSGVPTPPHALAARRGTLRRSGEHHIRLQHIFVDMTAAS